MRSFCCKLGEVVLKGLNRRSFEDQAYGQHPPPYPPASASSASTPSRVPSYVEPMAEETCDVEGAYDACKPGVRHRDAIARAVPCRKDKDAILAAAKTYLGDGSDGGPQPSRWRASVQTSPSP